MNMYRFPEKKYWKLAFGAIMFAILLLTRDSLFALMRVGFYQGQFLIIGLICLLLVVFLIVNRTNLKEILLDKRMLAVLISTGVILIPMVVKRDWQLMYFSILLCLYFAIFLTYFISCKEVARYYVWTMAVLSVYSLIATYVLKYLVFAGVLDVEREVYMNIRYLYSFGLSYVHARENDYRNYGMFREPGVYQYFLMLALYLNNYVLTERDWKHWLLNGILAVTLVSTFATGGIVELALFVVIVFFDRGYHKNKRIVKAVLIAGAVALVGVAVCLIKNPDLADEVSGMITKIWTPSHSSNARYGSILVDTELFFRNPIFGNPMADVLHSVDDNTTSTMILYAVLGCVGGSLNVAAWVALVWDKSRRLWVNLALLLVLFMSFNTQNLTTNIYFWLFPYMALVERGLPLLKLDRIKKKA